MELKLIAPPGLIEPLRALLDATPGVQYKERGWFVPKKVTITGSPEALEQLQPRLDAIQSDYASREAW